MRALHVLKLTAPTQRVPSGSCTCAANARRASATKPATSRPCTFTCTVTHRRAHSRLILAGPSVSAIRVTRFNGSTGPAVVGMRVLASASGSFRCRSGNRTARGNRRCPSRTSPTGMPPTASTMFKTCRRGTPNRAMASASTFTCRTGWPVSCSPVRSAAPRMPPKTFCTRSASSRS